MGSRMAYCASTSRRTALGLRRGVVGATRDLTLVAVTHALLAQTFIGEPRPLSSISVPAANSSAPARTASRIPSEPVSVGSPQALGGAVARDLVDFWGLVLALNRDSRVAVYAHCVALTINAVKLPRYHRQRAGYRRRPCRSCRSRHDQLLAINRLNLSLARRHGAYHRNGGKQ